MTVARHGVQDVDRPSSVTGFWGNPEDVLGHLRGHWRLDRSIEGHATMQGHAVFTPADEGSLHYREHGRLVLANGTELEAAREYVYAPGDTGFSVFFQERPTRLFHRITLVAGPGGELLGEADHPCAEDHYRSFYRFLPDGRFIVRHVVTGPRKGYTMMTTYAPASRQG